MMAIAQPAHRRSLLEGQSLQGGHDRERGVESMLLLVDSDCVGGYVLLPW